MEGTIKIELDLAQLKIEKKLPAIKGKIFQKDKAKSVKYCMRERGNHSPSNFYRLKITLVDVKDPEHKVQVKCF
jgi:hypothetical protein